MLSIESQRREYERVFGPAGLQVIDRVEEAQTAKIPGRPLFNDMLDRVDRGEAEGIVCWGPDRLARNSVDGGRIIYMLDRGVLKDLKFTNYTFENNSQGKFMLQIMFANSKYHSDSLSDNVRMAIRTKLANGWLPNGAPVGYLNDKELRTIADDPERLPFMRQLIRMVLAGTHSPVQVHAIARDEWGLRTRKTRKRGGAPLSLGAIYKILGNPFYAGFIEWKGERYQGNHTAIITLAEFNAVQRRLRRAGTARPQKHAFAFTGLMRCGGCGLMITAEQRINAYGSRYVYYHCTKRSGGPRCPEPPISAPKLEAQFVAFLETLVVDPRIERWVLDEVARDSKNASELEATRRASVQRTLDEATTQLAELTSLRLRRLLSDEEYVLERRRLEDERARLTQALANPTNPSNRFELFQNLFLVRNQAAEWFRCGSDREKRRLVEMTGSNFFLKGKILSIQAAKPFIEAPEFPEILLQCRVVDDVRNYSEEIKPIIQKFIKDTDTAFDDPSSENIPLQMELLRKHLKEGGRKEAA